jgi:hypothetical protein
MATRTREDLEAVIEKLNSSRVKELDAIGTLETKLDSQRRERAALEEKRLAACKLDALGEKNNHASIVEAIAASNVKIDGLEILIAEAHARVTQLRSEMTPLELELQALFSQEEIERQTRKLQELKRKGLDAGLAYWRAHANLTRAETELSTAFTDERLRSAGRDFAVSLEAAVKNGMRVSELFTPEELKEFV